MCLQRNLVGILVEGFWITSYSKDAKKRLLLGYAELEKLLSEDPSVVQRRGVCKQALIDLRKAKDEVEAMQ